MQFRLSHAFVVASLVAGALAAPQVAARTDSPPPACAANTGTLQCCSTTEATSNPVVQAFLGLLGIQVPGPLQNLLVGVACNAQVVGEACDSQAACCVDDSFNATSLNFGCTNIGR
ncbi:hypothetical protein B0H17DRAFT_1196183 [Mycena rosella]|uniref:Hydrophobin n=1 Tax=Mycena rosella TaxID=1033263 RepID=A0AAD7DWD8_MYCRO|nr:hypothetical protein B0H17DRAFT_1196183 [Mycena rosella]